MTIVVTRGRFSQISTNKTKNRWFLIYEDAPRGPRGSMNQKLFIELESIEFGCDHQLLKELEAKNHVKIDVFWYPLRIFFHFLMVFLFWYIPELMVAAKLNRFQFYEKFLKFWHPWWPCGRLHTILKRNQSISTSVLCGVFLSLLQIQNYQKNPKRLIRFVVAVAQVWDF